ncbi:hypothetical protein G7Y89_g15112 [Cudoniella acicularis]|uniref:Uncharacterized protein n=1 Tax=Cudoniella acicularis TaxID=354080 RepID=A0A8H4VND0_9HELO|nr:hypothetical protein G7Y89_g15112 [Cudoniella acicularis]
MQRITGQRSAAPLADHQVTVELIYFASLRCSGKTVGQLFITTPVPMEAARGHEYGGSEDDHSNIIGPDCDSVLADERQDG